MDPQRPVAEPTRFGRSRLLLALVCGALAIGYAVSIVFGVIPPDQRLDATALVALALATAVTVLILSPGVLGRFKSFELQGFKLEMLERVKDRQVQQEERLDDIALMLPLLFPERERTHILNLAAGRTDKYKGSHDVRVELRRLNSIGLLRKHPSRHIRELADGIELDLSALVELTPLGARWARRLKEIEATEKADNSQTGA